MDAPERTEVLIVGAGPTGLSLACQLERFGIDFVAVEKREGVTAFSKALAVQARTLEIYEQLGLADTAVERGTIASSLRLIEGGTQRGELDLRGVGEGLSPYPFVLVLEQSRNEQLLYDYLRANGRDVLWNSELQSFSQSADGVKAQVTDVSGAARTIEARYLAGCDGPRSVVRQGLGIGFEGSTFERIFYVADVQIDWQMGHDALNLCMAENSFVVFFPMRGENRYRIVGAFPEGLDRDEGDILYAEIEQRIKAEAKIPLEISHVSWFSTYKVHSRHASRFQDGRCFLAGDAAHVHTPAGGQGMNTGIQDAYNLAWKLAYVLRHNADPRILETYETERVENAKNLLKTTDRMFSLAAGTDWLQHLIRTTIFPQVAGMVMRIEPARKRFFSLVSQIGIEYRHSALSDHTSDRGFAVNPGDRMPFYTVDGVSIYDRLRAPRFHLLTFADPSAHVDPPALDPSLIELVDLHALPLDTAAKAAFGADRPFAVLLRPDNYIALITDGEVDADVARYFDRLIG